MMVYNIVMQPEAPPRLERGTRNMTELNNVAAKLHRNCSQRQQLHYLWKIKDTAHL